jgi:SAM-dependent methyltransferase
MRQPEQHFTLEPVGIAEEDAVRSPEIGDESVARAAGHEAAADLHEGRMVSGLQPDVVDRAVPEHRTAHHFGCGIAVHLEDVQFAARADVDHGEPAGADLLAMGNRCVEYFSVELYEPFGVVGDHGNMVHAIEQHVDSSFVGGPTLAHSARGPLSALRIHACLPTGFGTWQDRWMPIEPYYRAELARIHHEGFGFHAELVAPGIIDLLEPVRERGGLVLEIGCGSGLLTKFLVDAGHRVLATDASPAMLDIAREYAPGAEGVEQLRLPDDAVPAADAIVAVGHPLSYLDNRDELDRSLIALAGALRPGGILAFDICDLEWGRTRADLPPKVWFGDDWVLITSTSLPDAATFRRDMTMFVRTTGELWERADEIHDNILIDTAELPALLARHGINARIESGFGAAPLPSGLVAVIGRRTL